MVSRAWRFGAAWLLCCALLLSGCTEKAPSTATGHLRKAQEHLAARQYVPASVELKQALAANRNDPEARLLLGQLYLDAGFPANAEPELLRAQANGAPLDAGEPLVVRAELEQGHYEEVLKHRAYKSLSPPAHAELLSLHALAMLGLGNNGDAHRLADEALAVHPTSVPALTVKARLEALAGHLDQAKELLDRATALDGENAQTWSLIGDIAFKEGRLRDSEQALSNAIEHRLNNAKDLVKRALVRLELGQQAGAAEDLEALKQHFPRHPQIPFLEGRLAFARNDFAEARDFLRRAIQYDPQNTPAYFYLGSALFMLRDYDAAEEPLLTYLAQQPKSTSARKLLALIRIGKGDFPGAQTLLDPVLKEQPDETGSLRILATTLIRQGKVNEAISALSHVVQLQPDSSDAHLRLGKAQLIGNKLEDAIESFERAIELEPTNEKPYMLLTSIYLQQKEVAKALATAQRLQTQVSGSATALNMLGSIHLAKGEDAAATIAFKEAATRRPGDLYSHYQLAQMALAANDPNTAREHYQAVLNEHKDHLATLRLLAQLEASQSNDQSLEQILRRTIKAHPEAMDAYRDLAWLYLRQNNAGQAQSILTQAGGEFNQRPEWLLLQAQVLLASNDAKGAILTLATLLKTPQLSDPASVHYLRALAFQRLGDTAEMAKALDLALKADPANRPARISRTRLLIRQGRIDEAEDDLEQLGAPDEKKDADVLLLEGRIAKARHQDERATDLFREAFDKQPTTSGLLALAQQLTDIGRPYEGIKRLRDWMEGHPDDLRALRGLANAYRGIGSTDDALKTYQQILTVEPDNADALNNLAWLLLETSPSKALAYARQASQQDPDSANIMDTLAMVAWAAGQTELADRTFLRAIATDPSEPLVRLHYAQLLAEEGNADQAITQLHTALGGTNAFAERGKAEELLGRLTHP